MMPVDGLLAAAPGSCSLPAASEQYDTPLQTDV